MSLSHHPYLSDSVVFLWQEGDPKPETSDLLGGMKDEIAADYGQSAYISEFVSVGAKTYSLKIALPDGTFQYITRTKG